MLKTSVNKKSIPPLKIKIGSGFLLFMAAAYFFDSHGIVAAAIPAVVIHELGHIFAMRLFGAYPTALNTSFAGFSLDYSGVVSPLQEVFTALSGPFLGLFFSLLCALLAPIFQSEYLLMCAGLGFVLNCFNLLPVLPLDGGLAVSLSVGLLWGDRVSRAVTTALSYAVSLLLCLSGLYFLVEGQGAALLIIAIWLLVFPKTACKKTPGSIQ